MEAEPINSIGPGQYGDRHLQYDLSSQMMEHRGMTAETSLPLRQQCITPQQLSSKWSIERRVTQSTCAFHRQENGQVSRMCITGGTFTAVCDTMLLFTVRSLRPVMTAWHTNQETNSLQGEGRDPNPKGKCANLILNI